MVRKVNFPPKSVIDPDGNEWEVVDTEGGGAYVVYEQDGERRREPWVILSDPETDWSFVEPEE